MKKGGKGVPGRGNVAPLLPPPHANKNLRNRMSWDPDSRSPVSLFIAALTSTKVPAAAGSRWSSHKSGKVFKR